MNTLRIQTGTLVGQVVDGHRIERVLGAGAMGEVYLAVADDGEGRALKVIHDDQREDASARARFQREAMALGVLRHPNVVAVIAAGELANGWPFLLMEHVEGPTLEDLLTQRGPLDLRDALAVLTQLADALAHTHAHGIVHRDLKPANVILRDGNPADAKIIDFGLVHMLSQQAVTRLTGDQQMVGSPLFMAPEQADGSREPTGAADIYALAATAFATISGRPLFPGRKLLELVRAHEREVPELLSARVPEVPPPLDTVLAAMLAKRPEHRPPAAEVATRLRAIAASLDGQRPSARTLGMAQTVVSPSGAATRDEDPDAARLFASALTESDLREAVRNQAAAVVGELAALLGLRDLELERVEARIGELELELAVLEAEIADAPDDALVPVLDRRDALAKQLEVLQSDQVVRQRRLFTAVRRAPAIGRDLATIASLRDELATLVARLGGSR
jgi:predicted Ser/Thr protein kinase